MAQTPFNAAPLHPFDDATPRTRLVLLYRSLDGATVPFMANYIDFGQCSMGDHRTGWYAVDHWSGGARPILGAELRRIVGWSELAVDTTTLTMGPEAREPA